MASSHAPESAHAQTSEVNPVLVASIARDGLVEECPEVCRVPRPPTVLRALWRDHDEREVAPICNELRRAMNGYPLEVGAPLAGSMQKAHDRLLSFGCGVVPGRQMQEVLQLNRDLTLEAALVHGSHAIMRESTASIPAVSQRTVPLYMPLHVYAS